MWAIFEMMCWHLRSSWRDDARCMKEGGVSERAGYCYSVSLTSVTVPASVASHPCDFRGKGSDLTLLCSLVAEAWQDVLGVKLVELVDCE